MKKKEKEFEENIIRTDYTEVMQKSYIDYAMSVIISRALPDVRDGLKPVQRRVLYDMYELGIRYDRPYRKSARIVGDTMGKYHPHGDSSIYESLVVMAQDFKKGRKLVDGHGNFGSIEGDGAAAMRYTEARLEKLTWDVFLRDLDKDIVDFMPNFDETEKEPEVLPVRMPNILVNGAEGIAVGMATSIPPHNIADVINAEIAYIRDKDISSRELFEIIKGPDFPTGGIVINRDELPEIYETGMGKIRLRGKVETEKGKNGKIKVVITEIPYTMIGARIGKFLADIADLYESKKCTDISDISNQSSKEGIRIVVELKKGADADNFINLLYKKTKLEDTFSVNMLAVCNGRPETMSLKRIIEEQVDFRFELANRKYTRLLLEAKDRKEIQEGLIKACDVIDLIIEILRGSRNQSMAKACLTRGVTDGIKFKSKKSEKTAKELRFTERQAEAIFNMRLAKLIGLEIEALIREHEETLKDIMFYEQLLNDYDTMAGTIVADLEEIKKEYGTDRKTEIINGSEAVYVEEEKAAEMLYFIMDRFGYVRTVDKNIYEKNMDSPEIKGRFVFPVMSDGRVCIFTDTGKMHQIKVKDIPAGKLKDKGIPADNISNYTNTTEEIVYVCNYDDMVNSTLVFMSAGGFIKTTSGSEFDTNVRTIFATKIAEGDRLVFAGICDQADSFCIKSAAGYVLRIPLSEIPAKKKNAIGVKGIALKTGDTADNGFLLLSGKDFVYEENGRSVYLNRIKVSKRGGKGAKKF